MCVCVYVRFCMRLYLCACMHMHVIMFYSYGCMDKNVFQTVSVYNI